MSQKRPELCLLTCDPVATLRSGAPEPCLTSDQAPNKPPSGSLFIFNKNTTKRWRNDKHNWQRGRGNSRVNEHHENIKLKGVEVLNVCYVRAEQPETYRRRAYWMLQSWIDANSEQIQVAEPFANLPS